MKSVEHKSVLEIAIDAEDAERERFVQAALSYIGTPYHHQGRIKGVGVDCATMLILAGCDAGLIDNFELPEYSPQWMLHRNEEVYLEIIGKHCHEIEPPALPGDIAVWKIGRTFSHAAIVIEWPKVVHAVVNRKVSTDDVDKTMWLRFDENKPRPMKLFSFWGR
jgi:cell wall-associated NlpC family hydrolase